MWSRGFPPACLTPNSAAAETFAQGAPMSAMMDSARSSPRICQRAWRTVKTPDMAGCFGGSVRAIDIDYKLVPDGDIDHVPRSSAGPIPEGEKSFGMLR